MQLLCRDSAKASCSLWFVWLTSQLESPAFLLAMLWLSHCEWQPAHGTRAAQGWTKTPWQCIGASGPQDQTLCSADLLWSDNTTGQCRHSQRWVLRVWQERLPMIKWGLGRLSCLAINCLRKRYWSKFKTCSMLWFDRILSAFNTTEKFWKKRLQSRVMYLKVGYKVSPFSPFFLPVLPLFYFCLSLNIYNCQKLQ